MAVNSCGTTFHRLQWLRLTCYALKSKSSVLLTEHYIKSFMPPYFVVVRQKILHELPQTVVEGSPVNSYGGPLGLGLHTSILSRTSRARVCMSVLCVHVYECVCVCVCMRVCTSLHFPKFMVRRLFFQCCLHRAGTNKHGLRCPILLLDLQRQKRKSFKPIVPSAFFAFS